MKIPFHSHLGANGFTRERLGVCQTVSHWTRHVTSRPVGAASCLLTPSLLTRAVTYPVMQDALESKQRPFGTLRSKQSVRLFIRSCATGLHVVPSHRLKGSNSVVQGLCTRLLTGPAGQNLSVEVQTADTASDAPSRRTKA